jgi:hypothetical protein
MKKINYVLLLVSIIFSFSIMTERAFATVGGPTYISSIASNVENNSVYYTVHSNGGSGCPPSIHRVDLITLADSELKSCRQFEQEFSFTEEGLQKYSQFMADTYQDLPYLGSVSLKKNNIDITVEFLSEHLEEGSVFWREFRATMIQDNKQVAKIDFRGCAQDQPHVFEGYRIPNSDMMAILISNKGDCFEGGYLKEVLHIIKGVKYYDTNVVRSFKEESATEPNLANLIVHATTNKVASENPVSVPQKYPVSEIIWFVATFIVGIIVGYVVGKRTLRSNGLKDGTRI